MTLRQAQEMEHMKLVTRNSHAKEYRLAVLVKIRLSKNLNIKLKCTHLTYFGHQKKITVS